MSFFARKKKIPPSKPPAFQSPKDKEEKKAGAVIGLGKAEDAGAAAGGGLETPGGVVPIPEQSRLGGLPVWSKGKGDPLSGVPLLRGGGLATRSSVIERLRGLKGRDLAFIASGLAVLIMAPLAEYLMTGPDEGGAKSMQGGFAERGPMLSEGANPFEGGPGGVGIAPGGLIGQDADVITPLNVRDPSHLILGPGNNAASAPAPVAPGGVSIPKPPPKDDHWGDAINAAKRGVTRAVQRTGLPRPSGKLPGALRGFAALTGGSSGGPSMKLEPPVARFGSPRAGSSLTRIQGAPGFRGGMRSLAGATGGSGGGRFGGPGFGGSGATFDGLTGSGAPVGQGIFGGRPSEGSDTKNPGNNSNKDTKTTSVTPIENLALLRAKMELEKSISLKWDKRRYDQLERKKMLEQIAAQTIAQTLQQALLKILDKLLEGKKGDDKKGGEGKPGGGSPGTPGPQQPRPENPPREVPPTLPVPPTGPPTVTPVPPVAPSVAQSARAGQRLAMETRNSFCTSAQGLRASVTTLQTNGRQVISSAFDGFRRGSRATNTEGAAVPAGSVDASGRPWNQAAAAVAGDVTRRGNLRRLLEPDSSAAPDAPNPNASRLKVFQRGEWYMRSADSLEQARARFETACTETQASLQALGEKLGDGNDALGGINTAIGQSVQSARTGILDEINTKVRALNATSADGIAAADLQRWKDRLSGATGTPPVVGLEDAQRTHVAAIQTITEALGPIRTQFTDLNELFTQARENARQLQHAAGQVRALVEAIPAEIRGTVTGDQAAQTILTPREALLAVITAGGPLRERGLEALQLTQTATERSTQYAQSLTDPILQALTPLVGRPVAGTNPAVVGTIEREMNGTPPTVPAWATATDRAARITRMQQGVDQARTSAFPDPNLRQQAAEQALGSAAAATTPPT